MIRVTQLTDTHFTEGAGRSHGGMGYDTDETWAEVRAHAFGRGTLPDLVVITGDIADTGAPGEYRKAAAALADIPAPAYVLPGNHDFQTPFDAILPRPGLDALRTLTVGDWLFVFADSNAASRVLDVDGRAVDRDDRIHLDAGLGAREIGWLDDTLAAAVTEHVFVWVHHPPAVPGAFNVPAYDEELEALLLRHRRVRGVAGGHVHTDRVEQLANRPVFVCPALATNIDMEANTSLPPGYRTFEFHDDGHIVSEAHLIEDERWPRRDFPPVVFEYFAGRIELDELWRRLRDA
ncbi:MAG: metallophosphoesterase [Acidimicrobiia bacterium]|nr:metallophosphoesterase [Acidimicrobiia bacterium]